MESPTSTTPILANAITCRRTVLRLAPISCANCRTDLEPPEQREAAHLPDGGDHPAQFNWKRRVKKEDEPALPEGDDSPTPQQVLHMERNATPGGIHAPTELTHVDAWILSD
jgi:hypothetical protein